MGWWVALMPGGENWGATAFDVPNEFVFAATPEQLLAGYVGAPLAIALHDLLETQLTELAVDPQGENLYGVDSGSVRCWRLVYE